MESRNSAVLELQQKIEATTQKHKEKRTALEEQFNEIQADKNRWDSDEAKNILKTMLLQERNYTLTLESTYNLICEYIKDFKELRNKADDQLSESIDYLQKVDHSLVERSALDTKKKAEADLSKEEDLAALAYQDFPDAVAIFNQDQLVARITDVDLIPILKQHEAKGINGSATPGFTESVADEVIKRINDGRIAFDSEVIGLAKEHFKNDENQLFRINNAYILQVELRANAFKKIYHALHAGQASLMKTNFLNDKENLPAWDLLTAIKIHLLEGNHRRTAVAWNLTQKFYLQSDLDKNAELIAEIRKESFARSNWFYRKTQATGTTLFASCSYAKAAPLRAAQIAIAQDKEDSCTQKIVSALKI